MGLLSAIVIRKASFWTSTLASLQLCPPHLNPSSILAAQIHPPSLPSLSYAFFPLPLPLSDTTYTNIPHRRRIIPTKIPPVRLTRHIVRRARYTVIPRIKDKFDLRTHRRIDGVRVEVQLAAAADFDGLDWGCMRKCVWE